MHTHVRYVPARGVRGPVRSSPPGPAASSSLSLSVSQHRRNSRRACWCGARRRACAAGRRAWLTCAARRSSRPIGRITGDASHFASFWLLLLTNTHSRVRGVPSGLPTAQTLRTCTAVGCSPTFTEFRVCLCSPGRTSLELLILSTSSTSSRSGPRPTSTASTTTSAPPEGPR